MGTAARAKKVHEPVLFLSSLKHSIMLFPLTGAFSIGLQLLSAVRLQAAAVDFVNPNLGGGSMLDNGELNFC
jgi:hypothetical protein